MLAPRVGAAVITVACVFVSCHRESQRSPAHSRDAEELTELASCLFDRAAVAPDAAFVESAIRRALRRDRLAFAERAGRCTQSLSDHAEVPASWRAMATAWNELLPLAQQRDPTDLSLERAIRHVGNAWRDVQRAP